MPPDRTYTENWNYLIFYFNEIFILSSHIPFENFYSYRFIRETSYVCILLEYVSAHTLHLDSLTIYRYTCYETFVYSLFENWIVKIEC